jgi:hypothetical protein
MRTLADGTHLEPGANIVENEILTAALKVTHQKSLFDKGFLSYKDVPVTTPQGAYQPGDHVVDLSTLKVPDAVEAIAACESRTQLVAWAQLDGRKRVRTALTARAEQLAPESEQTFEIEAAE